MEIVIFNFIVAILYNIGYNWNLTFILIINIILYPRYLVYILFSFCKHLTVIEYLYHPRTAYRQSAGRRRLIVQTLSPPRGTDEQR